MKLIVGHHVVTILCVNAQQWSNDGVKDLFFDAVTAMISGSEFLTHVEIGMAM